jgi:hypothetical protein
MAGVPNAASRFASGILLAGVLAAAATGVPAADQKGLPRAEDVVKKAIERARWSDEQKFQARYSYTQRNTVDELDSKENVKRHEVRVFHMFPVEGEPYAQLVEKNGKPLSAADLKNEQEREKKFRQRVAERKRRNEKKEDDEEVKFDAALASKYRFEVTGQENVNGRPAYVLTFEPQNKNLPVRRKLDRLLNKVAGRLWIDTQDYEIARADLHLAENVSAWGGLLASVRKFFLRFEQTKVDSVAWRPSFADGYVDGRILVRSLHLKVRLENSDFRRVNPPQGAAGASRP